MIQLIILSTFPKHLPFAGNGKMGYLYILSSSTGEDPSYNTENKLFFCNFFPSFGCVDVHSILFSPFPFWYMGGEIKDKKNNTDLEN